MMSEINIAKNTVIPILRKELLWPSELIRDCGRVAVQPGASTKWTDVVSYSIDKNNLNVYLLVEVKQGKYELVTYLAPCKNETLSTSNNENRNLN
jgi:hypothetical protein